MTSAYDRTLTVQTLGEGEGSQESASRGRSMLQLRRNFCTSSTPLVSAVNHMAARTCREKKNKSFFPPVYINLDNRERARARNKQQRRPISLEEKHENYIAAVRVCCTCKVVFSANQKKSVLHVQSLFFANQICCCCFFTVLVVFTLSLVLLDFIFSLRKLLILTLPQPAPVLFRAKEEIEEARQRPYDPTTATSMKTSLKNSLHILSLFSRLFQRAQLLKRREFGFQLKRREKGYFIQASGI